MDKFVSLSRAERLEALSAASDISGHPLHLFEKDVWVVWALGLLFTCPFSGDLAFKGGTSLSKAFGMIRRFSEDVDLTYGIQRLLPDDILAKTEAGRFDPLPVSGSQQQKITRLVKEALPVWLKNAVLPVIEQGLAADGLAATVRLDEDRLFIEYEPLAQGTGYVAPRVMLEFGARSTGEPCMERHVICDAATHLNMLMFPEARPRVMMAERTFWEKATAIHVYCLQNRLRGDRFSRHWHDLARMDAHGVTDRALRRRDIAAAVAQHKQWFFAEKDALRNAIDYRAAVTGQISLIPAGEALEALRVDYAAMAADGLLLDDVETFEALMATSARNEALLNQGRPVRPA